MRFTCGHLGEVILHASELSVMLAYLAVPHVKLTCKDVWELIKVNITCDIHVEYPLLQKRYLSKSNS